MLVDNNLFNELAILTPSRITTEQRYTFAKTSLDSLRHGLERVTLAHVVVHDSPGYKNFVSKSFRTLIPSLDWDSRAKGIYSSSELIWMIGDNKGSATALLKAVNVAIERGKIFGFIHLDDHIYTEEVGALLSYGLDAMFKNEHLLWTRFSGYPLIYNNKEQLRLSENGEIFFDGVSLKPRRNEKYTLWHSPLTMESNKGNYWPIALWFCIYRLPVLKVILEWAIDNKAKHLAHAELFYKKNVGFARLNDKFPAGEFGYINMQFGGVEMHRNPNWKELLALPNEGLL